uniref:FimD/PapC N-terminal domain-containing protein n=1 Tax=Escherichia coli TaxID=562 RepID=UPI003AF0FD13
MCRAFSTSAITEGTYSLDVYTNDEWKGRYDLRIARDKDGRLGVCYTKAMLAQYGIAAEKLNPQLSEQEGYCGSLKSRRNEENVKDNSVQSSLRLNISVPQIYEDQRLKKTMSARSSGTKVLPRSILAGWRTPGTAIPLR